VPEGDPRSLATRTYRAIVPEGAARPRRFLGAVAVAILAVLSAPLLLAAFLTPLFLFGLVARHVFPVVSPRGLPPYSPQTVAVVTIAYALAVVGFVYWRWRSRTPGDNPGPGRAAQDAPPHTGPVRVRHRIRGHVRPATERRSVSSAALEWGIYVVASLLLMWPVTLHLSSKFLGWKDAHYYMWLTWRVGDMIRHGHIMLRIPDVVWPYGSDLRLLDGQLPTAIGGLWQAIAPPFLGFNLALVTASLLNMWAGRRIARLFSQDRTVWIMTALAFATAPAIAARLVVHITLYFAFSAALIVEEGIRVARGDHPVRPVRLGLLLFVAYLCSVYYLVFGAVAFLLLVATSRLRREGIGRTALRTAGALGLLAVVLLPFAIPRLALDRAERAEGRNPIRLSPAFQAEADALSVVAQPATTSLDLPGEWRLREHFRKNNVHESTIFPGFLLLGGLSGLALLRLPLRMPLVISTLTLWLLSLGPSLKFDGRFVFATGQQPVAWMPYTPFFWVPGLASLRSPNRVSFTVAALLAAALAASMGHVFRRYGARWQRLALSLAAATLLATNLLLPARGSTLQGSIHMHRALEEVAKRARPGQSMVQIPADCTSTKLLWDVDLQILHRTPLVGCQASAAAIPWASGLELYHRSSGLAGLRCHPEFLVAGVKSSFMRHYRFRLGDVAELRRDLGVRFFLVDREALSRGCPSRLDPAVRLLVTRFEVLSQTPDWMVIDTGPSIPSP
jgi:hypothetical protein